MATESLRLRNQEPRRDDTRFGDSDLVVYDLRPSNLDLTHYYVPFRRTAFVNLTTHPSLSVSVEDCCENLIS